MNNAIYRWKFVDVILFKEDLQHILQKQFLQVKNNKKGIIGN